MTYFSCANVTRMLRECYDFVTFIFGKSDGRSAFHPYGTGLSCTSARQKPGGVFLDGIYSARYRVAGNGKRPGKYSGLAAGRCLPHKCRSRIGRATLACDAFRRKGRVVARPSGERPTRGDVAGFCGRKRTMHEAAFAAGSQITISPALEESCRRKH